MVNGAFRKPIEKLSWPYQSSKKRRNNTSGNKEKLFNYKIKNDIQYLYRDPAIIRDATGWDFDRLEGGEQNDVFHDCFPYEYEEDTRSILEEQFEILEVLNQMKSPRKFKGLLKQMAYISNVLYRSFRQAYNKTRRNKQKTNRNYFKKRERSNLISPLGVVDLTISPSKQDCANEAHFDTTKKEQQIREKSAHGGEYTKDQECFCHACISCPKLGNVDKENICPICFGYLDDEIGVCGEEYLVAEKAKGLKENDNKNIIHHDNEASQQQLYFSDKYAVLREEVAGPRTLPQEPQIDRKTKRPKQTQTQSPNKQVFNLSPVRVTVPLKLQIDGQNCQSRFIETDIVMDAFGGHQANTLTCIKKPCNTQKSKYPLNLPKRFAKEDKFEKIQSKSVSDMFCSCISSSGMIQSNETQSVSDRKALNEILDIVKEHLPALKVTQLTQSTGVQSSLSESLIPYTASNTAVFTQTADTSSQLHPKLKARHLREDLIKEIRAVLEQPSGMDIPSTMVRGTGIPIVTNLSLKETPRPKEVKLRTTTTGFASLQRPVLAAMTGLKGETRKKPEIPPKPIIATQLAKFTTETKQMRDAAAKFIGPSKINEMRRKIQEVLTALLNQDSTTPGTRYQATDRDEILLDIHRLFHPEKAGLLPEESSRENALEDIRYLLQPEVYSTENVTAATPKTSGYKFNILQSIRHLLKPSSVQTPTEEKYSNETKDKILEEFFIVLKPRHIRDAGSREIRDSVLHDLRFMLNSGQEDTEIQDTAAKTTDASVDRFHQRQQKSNEIRDSVMADLRILLDSGSLPDSSTLVKPDTSPRAELVRQQRQQKPRNELRDSVMADIRHLLDSQPDASNLPKPNTSSRAELVRQQRQQKLPNELRDSVMVDLKYLLDSDKQLESSTLSNTNLSSRAELLRQQRKQQKPSNELRDSVMADLKYLLDSANQPDSENLSKPNTFSGNELEIQQRQRKPSYELRNSVMADLKYLLDSSNQPEASPEIVRQQRTQEPNSELRDSVMSDIKYTLGSFNQADSNTPLKPNTSSIVELLRQQSQQRSNDLRDSVMADLRYLLDSGNQPDTSNLGKQNTPSTAELESQQRRQRLPNELRDSVLSDVKHLLDSGSQAQDNGITENAATEPRSLEKQNASSNSLSTKKPSTDSITRS